MITRSALFSQFICALIFTVSILPAFACVTPPTAFSMVARSHTNGTVFAPQVSSSEAGVSYQLYKDGVAIGSPRLGTGGLLDFGNQEAGTYTVVGTEGTCATTMSGSVLVTAVNVGNPDEFGQNVWNVYGFLGKAFSRDSLTYYGFYHQDMGTNHGFKSDYVINNGWDALTSPSHSPSWYGTDLPDDGITFSHKRRGFPCGRYQLKLQMWDDATRVLINGVQVWSCSFHNLHASACVGVIGIYELDANTTIEVITNDSYLSARAELVLQYQNVGNTGVTMAVNGDSRSCVVKGNTWVDFFAPNTGRYIGSVKGANTTSNLGTVTLTSYVSSTDILVPTCEVEWAETAVMRRHWTINTTSVNDETFVRLPYTNGEFQALGTASQLSSSTSDYVSYPDQTLVKMSQYSGPNGVDADPLNNCLSTGGNGGTVLKVNSGKGQNLFTNQIDYFSIFNVAGFSELWLHGATITTALGIIEPELITNCESGQIQMNWLSEMENQMDEYEIQISEDGFNWSTAKKLKVANDVDREKNYTESIPMKIDNGYVQLVQKDRSGNDNFFGPYVFKCDLNRKETILAPNPCTDKVNVLLGKDKAPTSIQILNLDGQLIRDYGVEHLSSTIQLELDFPAGVYLMQLISDTEKEVIRLVKQ